MYPSYTINTSVFFVVSLGELSLPKNTSVVIVHPGLFLATMCEIEPSAIYFLLAKYFLTVVYEEYIGYVYDEYIGYVYDEYISNRCILRSTHGRTVITDGFFGKDSSPRFTTKNTEFLIVYEEYIGSTKNSSVSIANRTRLKIRSFQKKFGLHRITKNYRIHRFAS